MGVGAAVLGCGFGGLGVLAGAAARLLLGRLPRGVPVRAGCCEVSVGVLWGVTGVGWVLGFFPGGWVPLLLGLGWLGVAAGVVDLRRHRLPDALTLPALPVAMVLLVPLGAAALLRGLAGAATAAVVYAAGYLASGGALGAGDVKLAAPLGAVLAAGSWPALLLAGALAAGLTALVALVMAAVAGARRSGPAVAGAGRARARCPPPDRGPADARPPWWRISVPHGPSMLVSTWLVAVAAAAGAPLGDAPAG